MLTELPPMLTELPPGSFDKQDAGDDRDFYAPPRLVTHIDEGAVVALTAFYAEHVPYDGTVLDLMSSWVSHLPHDFSGEAIGHGMNAAELDANPQLSRRFVQDLNRDVVLPVADASLDAALCCVGVQYLQDSGRGVPAGRPCPAPWGSLHRELLQPLLSHKAVAIWRALDTSGHAALVRLYMERAGLDVIETQVLADGSRCDPLVAVTGRRAAR